MVCSISVDKSEEKLKINSDSYDLNRISDVQVKELTWKDKLTNMFVNSDNHVQNLKRQAN